MKLPQFPESYWLNSTNLPSYPKLTQDINVDVAIIGAGISGITTAYLLSKHGLSIAVIEAGQILTGTTGHTTAKITAQHDLIYEEFISHFGQERAKLYYEANNEAIQFIKQTIKDHSIDCDFMEENSYIYTNSDNYLTKLTNEFKAYQSLGIPGAMVDGIPLPLATKGALVMNNQAQFNPVTYLKALIELAEKQGVKIYENTAAISVDKGNPASVITKEGNKISCKHVVSCSHFPFYDGGEFYFARMYAERSYVLGVKAVADYPGGMYISAEDPKRSIRSAIANGEKIILIGGGNHKTGQGICTIKYYEGLQLFAQENFGIKEICYRWSAQDLTTLDKLPFIGQTHESDPHIFVATGYKKWGMTTGTAAALLIEKLVTGQESPYKELFSPSRFYADPTLKQFFSTTADVAKHLIGGKLKYIDKYPEQLNNDEGSVVTVNGKRAGAYRDPKGGLHLLDTTCTHMGCEVEWNEGERTWDCPCHGSRFSYEGEVINGPADKPLKKID